jgi:hypothetical protein
LVKIIVCACVVDESERRTAGRIKQGRTLHDNRIPYPIFDPGTSPQWGCEFLAELTLCGQRVELTSLRLDIVNANLAEFLSKTSSLQELDLGKMDDEQVILRSLRINGTLQRVTMPGEVQSRLANSFCLRNKHIAQLVQQVTETKPSRSRDQSSAGPDRSTQGRQGKSLVPTLLQSGKQITAVRASILLSGLRRLGESIGPITD